MTKNQNKPEQHGMSKTAEYKAWSKMKERCYSKNYDFYKSYGGRGISVCAKWKDSFMAFYNDMGEKPSKRHQLDRRDNDGNYEANNCRWVLPVVNQHNRSNSKLSIEDYKNIVELYESGKLSQNKIAKKYNVNSSLISRLIKNQHIFMNVETG